jgi:hypothetical protein
MPGFINPDRTSLANGIPARHIGPETGSSGNATVTNKGGTSAGTNEAADSHPAGASGLDTPIDTGAEVEDEARSFSRSPLDLHRTNAEAPLRADLESAAAQIADGGDRIRRDDEEEDADSDMDESRELTED